MFDPILVPTDGSERARQAAEQAVALGGSPTIHALTVVDLSTEAGPFSAGGVDESYRERRLAAGRERVRDLADALDAEVTTAVRTGRPHEAITDYAAEHGVEAVAMATRGRTGVRRLLAGSVTERVLRHADRPVLAVQPGIERGLGECSDLLVPTDGSDTAETGLDCGIALAQHLDARLHVLSVVDVGSLAARPGLTPTGADLQYMEAEQETVVEPAEERGAQAGLETVTEVQEGLPAQDIVAYAEREAVGLLVLGTHGHSGVDRLLAGSVTERVLRRADAPVLAVPA